jgi:hypothetical protein
MTGENRNDSRDKRRCSIVSAFGSLKIEMEDGCVRLIDGPLDINGIIVRRVRRKRRARWRLGHTHVHVHGRCWRMVVVLDVDVQKRRLQKAPKKDRSAQNCAGCPHEF